MPFSSHAFTLHSGVMLVYAYAFELGSRYASMLTMFSFAVLTVNVHKHFFRVAKSIGAWPGFDPTTFRSEVGVPPTGPTRNGITKVSK